MWPASACAGVPAPPDPSGTAWAGTAKIGFCEFTKPDPVWEATLCAIPQAALGEFTRSDFQTIPKIIIGYVLTGSKLQSGETVKKGGFRP